MSASATRAAGTVARRRRTRRSRGERHVGLSILAVLTALWLLAPVAVLIPLSFTGERSFTFPPESWSTEWWESLLTEASWERAIVTSVVVGLLVVAASVVLGTMAALGLTRGRFPGLRASNGLLLAPLVIPLVVTG